MCHMLWTKKCEVCVVLVKICVSCHMQVSGFSKVPYFVNQEMQGLKFWCRFMLTARSRFLGSVMLHMFSILFPCDVYVKKMMYSKETLCFVPTCVVWYLWWRFSKSLGSLMLYILSTLLPFGLCKKRLIPRMGSVMCRILLIKKCKVWSSGWDLSLPPDPGVRFQ